MDIPHSILMRCGGQTRVERARRSLDKLTRDNEVWNITGWCVVGAFYTLLVVLVTLLVAGRWL